MPLVSVKLPENTKQRVAQLAISHGSTAHAVMVQAIESAVERAETYDTFVADALRAREAVYQTGKVYACVATQRGQFGQACFYVHVHVF